MITGYGKFLIVLGGVWGLIGAGNIVQGFGADPTPSGIMLIFILIFNVVLFIIPGAICAGIGSRFTAK